MPTGCCHQLWRGGGPGLCILRGPSLLLICSPLHSLQVQGTQALRCQSHQQLQVDHSGLHWHRNHRGRGWGKQGNPPGGPWHDRATSLAGPTSVAGRSWHPAVPCTVWHLGLALWGHGLGAPPLPPSIRIPYCSPNVATPNVCWGHLCPVPCTGSYTRGQAGREKRAQERSQGCLALLWVISPCLPLLWCLAKGVARVAVPQVRGSSSGGVALAAAPVRRWPCPTSGWRGTCLSVRAVPSATGPAAASGGCRTGGVSGARPL